MNRRNVIGLAAAAPLVFGFPDSTAKAGEPFLPSRMPDAVREPLTDVNVSLFRWPLRRLRFDDTPALVAKLRSHNVRQAWAGSFEGLLHRDIAGVNARLASECERHGKGLLMPFGSVNPMLPDWEDDLRRCAETHRMRGIRLHPGYHGYDLDAPEFEHLLRLCVERGLIVQLAVRMEDERMMNPRLRVPPVSLGPLDAVLKRVPGARIMLLNALSTSLLPPLLNALATGQVHVEVSTLEGVGGLGRLLGQIPADRVHFGSHAPLFYHESAVLKLIESPLSRTHLEAVRRTNSEKLLASAHM